MDEMHLRFHIVVTPGAANLAVHAVRSLLRCSPYEFNLVANGLRAEELALIERFSAGVGRVSHWHLPERAVLPHGVVLSRLFVTETAPYFCFADADLFATGPFGSSLDRALRRGAAAVTAGYHLLLDPQQDWPGFEGKRLKGPQGETLGVTFFAVYKRRVVEHILSRYGVLFERYDAFEQLPVQVQNLLRGGPYHARAYDTAKVLNILIHREGERIEHLDLPQLVHIGGLCGKLMPQSGRLRRIRRWLRLQNFDVDLDDHSLFPPRWKRFWWWLTEPAYYADRWGTYVRERAAEFFARYVLYLEGRAPAPRLGVRAPELRRRIELGMFALWDAWRRGSGAPVPLPAQADGASGPLPAQAA